MGLAESGIAEDRVSLRQLIRGQIPNPALFHPVDESVFGVRNGCALIQARITKLRGVFRTEVVSRTAPERATTPRMMPTRRESSAFQTIGSNPVMRY